MPNFAQIRQQGARKLSQLQSGDLPKTNPQLAGTKPQIQSSYGDGIDATDTGYQLLNKPNGAYTKVSFNDDAATVMLKHKKAGH